MSGSSAYRDTIGSYSPASGSPRRFVGRFGRLRACGRPRTDVGRDRADQFCSVDRFGQVVVAAGGKAAIAVAGHRVGRNGQDRLGITAIAENPRRLTAVHLRHVNVH